MRLSPFALALFAPLATAGDVRVVGPGHFATIQDAITVSADGDVILIQSGTYNTARITGKSVAVVADVGATVQMNGAMRVHDTSLLQPVVVAGLKVNGIADVAFPELMSGLYASNCDGSLVVQDCLLTGSNTIQTPCYAYTPRGGAEIVDCTNVAISRCTTKGNVGRWNADFPIAMGSGLSASANSIVSFDHGAAAGGYGGAVCSGYEDGSSGGHGVLLKLASSLYASGSALNGANGIAAPFPPTILLSQVSGSGGNGIVHQGTGSSPVWLLASTTNGGAAGMCAVQGSSTCQDGSAGTATSGSMMLTNDNAPYAPKLSGPSIARDDEVPEFRVDAQPGARIELTFSREAVFVPQPAQHGVLHVANPRWARFGDVPAGGDHATKRYVMPDLPPSDAGRVVYMQARVTTPGGVTMLSNPHALVIVDTAY